MANGYKPSPYEIATKSSELKSFGIHRNDAFIEALLIKEREEKTIAPEVGEGEGMLLPSQVMPLEEGPAGFGENALDAIGSFAWNAIDTGTFGVAGLAAQKVFGEEAYSNAMYELQDTTGGRIGGTVGSLAGFMVPMGWVGKGTSAILRGGRTLHQHRKIKKGIDAVKKGDSISDAMNIARPTTATIQKQAALKIMETERKLVGQTSAKLTYKDALEIAKQNTDDIIGFTSRNPGNWKGVLSQVRGGQGPAYQMSHNADMINQTKLLMQNTLPEKLAASLAAKGVTNISKKGLTRISDDVIEAVARKPFNQIEEVLGALHPPFIGNTIMPLVGGMAQEAVNFGIVGTLMDYAQYLKGEQYLDLKEHSFPERMLHHALMGSAFGGVRFVPGGRGAKVWKDAVHSTGRSTKKLNETIKSISDLDQLKALARLQMKNSEAAFVINGKQLSERMLRKGVGVTQKEMGALKQEMINYNNDLLASFRKVWKGDAMSDIAGSFPRMAIGATIFNWASLEDGAFANMAAGEIWFHLGLGAIMTKSHRPLRTKDAAGKPLEPKAGIHMGERPYYYTGDMAQIVRDFKTLNINAEHIGSVVKQFEGNLFHDWVAKHSTSDIESIIEVLKDTKVIYSTSQGTVMPDSGKVANLTPELTRLVSGLGAQLQTRNFAFNPNITKAEQAKAVELISKIESSVLSTPDRKILLNSNTNIRKSILQGASEGWAKIKDSHFHSWLNQIGILTGDPQFVGKDGRMPEINFGRTKDNIDVEYHPALTTFKKITEDYISKDYIKVEDLQVDKGRGFDVELTNEKMRQLKEIQDAWGMEMGKEFYGESSGEPVRMTDGTILKMMGNFDYQQNIVRVFDMLQGREPAGATTPSDVKEINSLITEIFSSNKDRMRDATEIVENPNLIVLDLTNSTMGPQEINALEGFKRDMWSLLTATGRAPVDGRKVKIDVNQLLKLSEKLTKNGMPDPVEFSLDSRLTGFFDRLRTHAIEEVTGGLDMDVYTAAAVKRLMINGLVQRTGKDADGYGLMAPLEITRDQIRQAAGRDIKPEEIDTIQKNWKFILSKINDGSSRNIVHPRPDIRMSSIGGEQLTAINATRRTFELEKLGLDIMESNKDIDQIVIGIQTKTTELNQSLEALKGAAPEVLTARSEIIKLLEYEQATLDVVNQFKISFSKAFTGTPEVTRASAHMELFKSKELMRKLNELDASDPNFETRTKELKELQVEIANQVANRADVLTSIEQRQIEDIARQPHDEPSGTIKKENTNITPDSFMVDRNISYVDLYAEAGKVSGIADKTYHSTTEAVSDLYFNTMHRNQGGIEKFTDVLFKIAGETKASADSKLRNEIQVLSNLMERRYEIKRLTINTESGSGFFENTVMSKGFLTDFYSEVFKGTTDGMTLLQPDYMGKNNRMESIATNELALANLEGVLSNHGFIATEQQGGINALKYFQEGTIVEAGPLNKGAVDMTKTHLMGKQYVIGIDENIRLVIPDKGFDALAKSFMDWYAINKGSSNTPEGKYIRHVLNSGGLLGQNSNNLMARLSEINKSLVASGYRSGEYTSLEFSKYGKGSKTYIEDSIFTMMNVMYSQKVNKNWLQDAYFDAVRTDKDYKYKRLAQNQGYTRDSKEINLSLKEIWKNSTDEYAKDLINQYADKEFGNVFVLEDSQVSLKGEGVNGLLLDNRSAAEAALKQQFKDGDISEKAYNSMLDSMKDMNSINAEAPNAATVVRREFLDYGLLRNGNRHMIGESAGQKPVGLTSFTDANGVMHTFYNKTHYFYDSRFDTFFENNKHIDQIALTSGAKKHSIIDTNDPALTNRLKPYGSKDANSNVPKFGTNEGEYTNAVDWINGISLNMSQGSTHESVFPLKLDQSLSGVTYGKPKDARILKQFDNWTSAEASADLYNWARADLAKHYAEIMVDLMSPENVTKASGEAQSFLRSEGNKGGTIATGVPHASVAALWIEGSGVPFSVISQNLYTSMIKKRYIDDAGVFDGYTDAGGTPIVRPNWSGDLKIPVYTGEGMERKQIKLGEVHVGEAYLDRKITFHSRLSGGAFTATTGIYARPKKDVTSSLTIAVAHKGRDVVIDIAKKEIFDPEGRIKDLDNFSQGKFIVDALAKKFNDGTLETWRDVFSELKDSHKDAQLVVIAPPAPRTGPHDAIVAKIKGTTEIKDGGVMEMNAYDITMRAQRDFDTDKMSFYMDTPFSVLKESLQKNSMVLEADPFKDIEIIRKDTDLFDRQSWNLKDQQINKYKKLRGPVVKQHRKLTYMKQIFDTIGGIKLGDDTRLVFTNHVEKGMQRLTRDSQGVLDIYGGVPEYIGSNDYQNKLYFGDGKKYGGNAQVVEPFFQIESTKEVPLRDKAGNAIGTKKIITRNAISNEQHMHLINKIANDFGRLLQLESNVWEAGEAKKPRYEDLVSEYGIFKDEYNRKNVNWNFYHYISKRVSKSTADAIFFEGKPDAWESDMIKDVMGPLSEQIRARNTPFLKSLHQVANRDMMRIKETFSNKGDHFNEKVLDLIGQQRQNSLLIFENLDLMPGYDSFDAANNHVKDLWDGFSSVKNFEQMYVQANTIEQQIRRSEWLISAENKKQNKDDAFIATQNEIVQIKRKALQIMVDKMGVEYDPQTGESPFGQQLKRYNDKGNNEVHSIVRDVVIRSSHTGTEVTRLRDGDTYVLKEGEVAVFNPVTLKPVVEHEMIDGVAFAKSTLGYYSKIKESDMGEFRQIVQDTRREIRTSMKNIMESKGVRDWSKNDSETLSAIDRGLERLKNMVDRNAINERSNAEEVESGIWGKIPTDRQSYPMDFLMAMIVPDYHGNPNEYHFSPKNKTLVPNVGRPNKATISAVFRTIERYGLQDNYGEFIKDFANVHRGFYDTFVAGRGFHQGLDRLADTNFEGALLKGLIEKSMNKPWMQKKDFKTFREEMETYSRVEGMTSDYAELFRQILQEGALTDPQTAFNLRRQVIEGKESDGLGQEGYERMFELSRGRIILDGISGKQYSLNRGEGQLLGEVVMSAVEKSNRQVIMGNKRTNNKPGGGVKDIINDVIGEQNNKDGACGGGG